MTELQLRIQDMAPSTTLREETFLKAQETSISLAVLNTLVVARAEFPFPNRAIIDVVGGTAPEEGGLTSGERDCQRHLRTTSYDEDKDINPERVQGTCEWFLSQVHFTQWRRSKFGLSYGNGKSRVRQIRSLEVSCGRAAA